LLTKLIKNVDDTMHRYINSTVGYSTGETHRNENDIADNANDGRHVTFHTDTDLIIRKSNQR